MLRRFHVLFATAFSIRRTTTHRVNDTPLADFAEHLPCQDQHVGLQGPEHQWGRLLRSRIFVPSHFTGHSSWYGNAYCCLRMRF